MHAHIHAHIQKLCIQTQTDRQTDIHTCTHARIHIYACITYNDIQTYIPLKALYSAFSCIIHAFNRDAPVTNQCAKRKCTWHMNDRTRRNIWKPGHFQLERQMKNSRSQLPPYPITRIQICNKASTVCGSCWFHWIMQAIKMKIGGARHRRSSRTTIVARAGKLFPTFETQANSFHTAVLDPLEKQPSD